MSFKFDVSGYLDYAVNDEELNYAFRYFNGVIKIGMGDNYWGLKFQDGQISLINEMSADSDSDIHVITSEDQWEKTLAKVPEPFYGTFYGMYSMGKVDLSINNMTTIRYLSGVNRLGYSLREFANGGPNIYKVSQKVKVDPKKAFFEPIVGRYLNMDFDGITYRVYVEESGDPDGIPFMLQHTAGSDGRQYRYLMNDPEVLKNFRLITYDLPFHGKSVPPQELDWWKKPYKLTGDIFMRFVIALKKELNLDKAIFMGSSMGGHLAPDLAYYYPGEFMATIGVEAGLVNSEEARAHSDGIDFMNNNPHFSKEIPGASCESAIAPGIDPAFRKEILWGYDQGGTGIFAGDLYYYSFDHDLRGKADKIDVSKTMVYLLTGEYDFGTPPEVTQELADQIKGCKYSIMKGLGHFPMTESYEEFRKYLMPFLEEILEKASSLQSS